MSGTTHTTPPIARDLMTREVASVDPKMTLSELASFLDDHAISGALVRDDDGRPLGVVSVSDVSSARSLAGRTPGRAAFYAESWEAELDENDVAPMRIEEDEPTVADLMTPEVVSVPIDAPVTDVADLMLELHIHRVFVRQGNAIVGLVSTTDLLALLATPRAAG